MASHINNISKKANSVLGFMQRDLKHANRDLKELAYGSLLRTILEYSSTVWDPFYQKDKQVRKGTTESCEICV